MTKTFTPDIGLSCCFRQWRATETHCSLLHGYSLGVRITFEAKNLDHRNWVYDFGSTKWIKELLVNTFDHKTVVAKDDPEILLFEELQQKNMIDLVVLDAVGCEKFAQYIMETISKKVLSESNGRVKVCTVEVFEHGANSAQVSQ